LGEILLAILGFTNRHFSQTVAVVFSTYCIFRCLCARHWSL